MFSLTFLGHQGWVCRTGSSCVLIDPLLCEDFGHAHALGYRVHPPRVFTPQQLPPIDGVVLTHEHDDHFDIPSLARLPRTIPIHLSARSSDAARQALRTMGFQVHALTPGVPTAFGDLEVTPFCGDHLAVNCGDEWDTLPFLVRDRGGSGSFFSLVDITLTERHLEWVKRRAPQPGLVSWTNNALDWSHMAGYLAPRTSATQDCFVKMGMGHKLIVTHWGTPSAMLMCAGGFAFQGDRAWMNHRVFCVDNDAVCQGMAKVYPNERFVVTRPGQTFHMGGGRLKRVEDKAAFLETAPQETWPSRTKTDEGEVPDYAPATGRKNVTGEEIAQLEALLGELAASLVGGAIFKNLCSLLVSEVPDRALTFAFVVRSGDDDQRTVYEYAPTACAFTRAPSEGADAREAYLAGMECWASDLLAVLRGDLGPIALTFGRARLWNALPTRFGFDVFGDLYRMSHPLRRPAQTLAVYERLYAESAGAEAVYRGR
jgi:hypothetical protein